MTKQPLKTTIRENVDILRQKRGGKKREGARAFGAFCGVAEATIWRIDQEDGGTNVETLESIANKFGLEAWQLLLPGLDPANPPLLIPVDPKQRQLWASIEAVRKEAMQEATSPGFQPARKPHAHSIKRRRQ